MLRSPGKWTEEQVKAEVDKCDLRCTNCHRVRTALHWEALACEFK